MLLDMRKVLGSQLAVEEAGQVKAQGCRHASMHFCGQTVSCTNSQLGVKVTSQAMANGRWCAIAQERQRDAAGVVRAGLAIWVFEAEHRLWWAERGESVHFNHIGCLVMLQIIVSLQCGHSEG